MMAVYTMWVEGEWQGSQTGVSFLEDHPCKHLALGKVPVSPWTTQSSVLVGTNKPRAVGMARGTGKESQGPAWPGAEHCSEWRSGEHRA